jgi:hypothetical protein
MDNVTKIKKLRANAERIKDLFAKKIPMWQSDPKHFDKTRWGFVQGDNDGWYESQTVTLHFGAWAGVYGDGSTYKEIDLDGDIFREHFMKYLNSHKSEIMMGVAASIEAEAAKLKIDAEAELNKELTQLKELSTPQP